MSKQEKKGLVPERRFPEFKDAGAWDEKTLGDITKKADKKNKAGRNYPIYSINNKMGFVPQAEQFDGIDSNKRGYDITLYKVIGKNSFAYNPARINVGSIGYSGELHDIIISSLYVCFKSIDNVEDMFLQHFFNTSAFNESVNNNVEGGIRNYLFYENFSRIKIPLPKSDEQRRVADCLTSIDELITAQTQKLDVLKTHKIGLMQQLFPAEGETVPKLRFPEFRDKGAWRVKPLGKIAENLDSKRIPITEADRVKGVIPYYGASGIIDYVEGYIFDEELLCISEDGANLVTRTYPIAFSICGKTWVNNHAHVLKFKCGYTQTIVENYLNAKNLEDFLTGMAQPKLNQAKLEIIPIPLPDDEDEQQKIAECLKSIDDLISSQANKVEALKAHKKGLMQQLFPAIEEVST